MLKTFSVTERINVLLDKAYAKSAKNMLIQIRAVSNAQNSQMQRALRELEKEAVRLAEDDEKIQSDNAYLEKALNEHEQALLTAQTLIQANDNAIQESGKNLAISAVTAKVFYGIAQNLNGRGIDPLSPAALKFYSEQLKRSGIVWNTPNVLDFATNYVDSPAWAQKMNSWGKGYADRTRQTVLQGVQSGWGPRHTASQMRQIAENLPSYAAENLTRTLQLTSYRDASAAMEITNGQFIEGKIRIAKLDDRTCLSCIALHGTELEPGERINDHYRGRCSEFYQVIGGPRYPTQMQADSQPGQRRFVQYQSGLDWFEALPESRQKTQASFQATPAKWRAYKDGKISLVDFIGEHDDPVFGMQTPERSLIDILGRNAERYYEINQ